MGFFLKEKLQGPELRVRLINTFTKGMIYDVSLPGPAQHSPGHVIKHPMMTLGSPQDRKHVLGVSQSAGRGGWKLLK